ncbi:MAG TPA: sigma 54-interacting transcriptional regulator, partial [Candidatus Krumholzibacteria bacterium]|nr:sigma 54-interacting transcriptional regulator [Candidatus Krumholzibacteria bacterium]
GRCVMAALRGVVPFESATLAIVDASRTFHVMIDRERGGESLTLPLRAGDASTGTLHVTRDTPFASHEQHLLLTTAEFLGTAIEHERRWSIENVRHGRRLRFEALLPRIAESLDVRKVFVELSPLIREIIPHDVLTFALLLPDRSGVRVQAATERGVMDLPPYRFSNTDEPLDVNMDFLLGYDIALEDDSTVRARISPRSAPEVRERVTRPGPEWVKFLAQTGVHSVLRVPIRSSEGPIGGLAFLARAPDSYDEEDGLVASRLADQMALALAHQRLADAELRRSRLTALDSVLPQLETLHDIDDIAVTISRLAKGFLPHDAAGVMVSHSSGGHIHGVVDGTNRMSMEVGPDFMQSQFAGMQDAGYFLMRDIEILDAARRLVRQHLIRDGEPLDNDVVVNETEFASIGTVGVHSEMRVSIRQGDDMAGALLFAAREPNRYTMDDVAVATRFAERISLRLARERIEGATRRAREAAARAKALEERVELLQQQLERLSAHRAVGVSAPWKQALTDATQVAATDTTVLITGESGTGKEVIARLIHRGSKRAKGPFVALNCAALPEQLLESELFGHERGAFTGAVEARAGKIEQAAGGVLFLDEVGEMAPTVQAKFLRVLQEREFQRVGGTRTIKADVRIVAATNRDPRAAIASGAFREDLYYRLGVFEIHLPPLRERPEDILVLAQAFLDEVGESIGRPAAGISEDAREQLLVHAWPGNVRELRNAIERAVILCHGGLITREHLPITVSRPPAERVAIAAPVAANFPIEGVPLESVERELLVKAMAKADNNKSAAARLLGVSRGQLYSLLRKHGLTDARR